MNYTVSVDYIVIASLISQILINANIDNCENFISP